MSQVHRHNRKATDEDIIRLNGVGFSLTTIGRLLGVHPTTITLRLKSLGIEPADTRRAFMEDIFMGLSLPQQQWLISQMGPDASIKDFVTSLLVNQFVNDNKISEVVIA